MNFGVIVITFVFSLITSYLLVSLAAARFYYAEKLKRETKELNDKIKRYETILQSKNIAIRHERGIRNGHVLIKKEQYRDIVKNYY
jgi:uncharacterized membrane protein